MSVIHSGTAFGQLGNIPHISYYRMVLGACAAWG